MKEIGGLEVKNSIKLSRRELLAGTMVAGTCPRMLAQGRRAPAEPFVPSEGPNKPMGVGKGIHPGRVVWVHNPEVARWDGQTERMSVKSATGEWWDDSNCDPKIVDAMFSTSLQGLTGKKSDHDA